MPPSLATDLRLNPFLHIDGDRIYNPITDKALAPSDPTFAGVRAFIDRRVGGERLVEGGWVVRDDIARAYRLKIVSVAPQMSRPKSFRFSTPPHLIQRNETLNLCR